MAANGILYPLGAALAPNVTAETPAAFEAAAEPAAEPVPAAKQVAAAVRADTGGRNTVR